MQVNVTCHKLIDIAWCMPKDVKLEGQTHVWLVHTPTHLSQLADYCLLLNESELKKGSAFHFSGDRDRFIISRAVLRTLLGRYLSCSSAEISFSIGKNKKPFVQNAGSSVCYNVSHSGEFIIIAVSEQEVGIDIELINPQFAFRDVVLNYFSPDERKYLEASEDALTQFYLLWTRKEALMKATSKGIGEELSSITCLDGINDVKQKFIDSSNDWILTSFPVGDNYISSLALEQQNEIRFYRF